MDIDVRDAKIKDAKAMAPLLREIDRKEIWETQAMNAEDGLICAINISRVTKAVFVNGSDVPVMIFGVTKERHSVAPGYYCVWLLATDQISEISYTFLRRSREVVRQLSQGRVLYNYISNDNTDTIRWLNWLGFDIMSPLPYGWLSKPYCYIEKRG